MTDSLLPSNATALERSLEQTAAQSLELPVNIQHLWDPWKCPAALLPWLAHSLSVDEWSSTWPEDVQRQVIADSVPAHLKKGTAGAIKSALELLGVSVELKQWFETGGAPYTATLTAYASRNLDESGDTLLTPELQAQLWRVLAATKPRRTKVDFNVGVSQSSDLHVAVAGQCTEAIVVEAESETDILPQSTELFLSASGHIHDVCETQLAAHADKLTTSTAYCAASASMTEINIIVMECR